MLNAEIDIKYALRNVWLCEPQVTVMSQQSRWDEINGASGGSSGTSGGQGGPGGQGGGSAGTEST